MGKGKVTTLKSEKKEAKDLAEVLEYTTLCPDIKARIDAAVDSHQITRILAEARMLDGPREKQNIHKSLTSQTKYRPVKSSKKGGDVKNISQKRNDLRDVFAAYGYVV